MVGGINTSYNMRSVQQKLNPVNNFSLNKI